MKRVVCYFDGATEPTNPGGNMTTGSIVKVDGVLVYSDSKFYPAKKENTNNVSEYIAFGICLKYILDNGLDSENVSIMGDSQLVIKQMTGEWAIKFGAYAKYAIRCKELLSKFKKRPTIFWISRDQNTEADELSKGKLAANGVSVKTHSDDKSVITFGKYSGKSIHEIEDIDYLRWALKKVKLKQHVKSIIQSRISKLEYIAK